MQVLRACDSLGGAKGSPPGSAKNTHGLHCAQTRSLPCPRPPLPPPAPRDGSDAIVRLPCNALLCAR
eukprot:514073-Lingulodinium_polyedra.AAC.1